MGKTQPIQFALNSYKARSGLASCERLLNCYAEKLPATSPFQYMLIGTSGLKEWVDLNQFEPIYGTIKLGDFIYVVCGLNFYQIDSSKNVILKGTLGGTPDRVMMTNNRTQITILTSNGDSYYYDTSTDTFAKITDLDYQDASSVTTLNGYTIFSKLDSDQFFISALNDTTSYASLDFATAEALPDKLIRAYALNNELWLFGEESIEIWANRANVLFPFERVRSAFIEIGCAAKYSIINDQEGIFWLGDDLSIYQGRGYQGLRISTNPIEREIASYERVDDAFAIFYVEEGHRFYQITFPTANKTWSYDTTTGLWHERSSRNPTTLADDRLLWNSHVFFESKNLVGSKDNGIIYEVDLDTYQEGSSPIITEIITATIFSAYEELSFDRLVLTMDTGVGIDGSGQGTSPEIALKTSSDGGKNWTEELKQPLGEIGSYDTEVSWTKVGYGRSLIVKLRISDPVKRVFTGAFINYERGYS